MAAEGYESTVVAQVWQQVAGLTAGAGSGELASQLLAVKGREQAGSGSSSQSPDPSNLLPPARPHLLNCPNNCWVAVGGGGVAVAVSHSNHHR